MARVVPVGLQIEFEANKLQIVLGKERRDLGQGQAMLLDVEQEVPAFAEAEEVLDQGHILERGAVCASEYLLSESADVVRGRAITARRNEISSGNDISPCDLAVHA